MNDIGLRLRDETLSLAAMRELTAAAEAAGYTSVWLPEGPGHDAVAELITLLGASRRISLATGIIPVFGRLPTLTAAAMAVAAEAAPGRAILGVGIGHRDALVRGHGVEFARPLARTREFITIARRLLRGEVVERTGGEYGIEHFRLARPPAAPVPVYVAALRPAMLRLAGAVADGVLLNWATPERVRASIAHVRAGAEAVGRPLSQIRIASYLRTCVSDDETRVEQACREQIARYGAMVYYRNYFRELGFAAETAALEAAWARGDERAAEGAVSRSMIEALTIYGPAERCQARLASYRDAGLDVPIVAPFPIGEPVRETFERTIAGCAP